MTTKKIAMTMTFVATQEQTYKFVIFVALLEHRGTNFASLAIKFAGTEQTFLAPKLQTSKAFFCVLGLQGLFPTKNQGYYR